MICAEVCEDVVAQPRHRSIIATSDFDITNLPAPVNRRLNILAARLNPLDWFAQLHRNPAEQCFFRIDVELRAEAAADFGRDDAQAVFGYADHQRDLRSHEVRYLRRRPQRQLLLARKISGEHAARLHRDGRESLICDALLDDMI